MNIDEHYIPLINDLKAGKRVFFKPSKQVLFEMAEHFKQLNQRSNQTELEKLLCLIDHCAHPCQLFVQPLTDALNKKQDNETYIFLLTSSAKHILKLVYEGELRMPQDYLKAIKTLLSHKDPEVVEWTLRIVDQIPKVNDEFKAAVLQARPSLLKILNKHQKASRQIITMLEKRWNHGKRKT